MRRNGHKFNAKRTEVDGITFHSKAEAKRYGELKLLERAGQIRNLVLQPRYPLEVAGKKICVYRADFSYTAPVKNAPIDLWSIVVEDVKGMKTPMYRLKKKLVEALYGIEIQEIGR